MSEQGDAYLAKLLAELSRDNPPEQVPVPVTMSHEDSDPRDRQIVTDEKIPIGITAKNIFRHPAAQPLVLDLLLIDKYGALWLDWEYETLEHLIPRDFGIDRVSDLNMSKIQAVKTLHLSDTFWKRWEVFCWVAMPLNALFPDFKVMQVPTVYQCMLAVDTAKRIRGDVQWSDEICAYLAVVHRHDGVMIPQAPLDFVSVDVDGYPFDAFAVRDRWPSVRSEAKYLFIRKEFDAHRVDLRRQLEIVHAT
jgi:hypothetical protein